VKRRTLVLLTAAVWLAALLAPAGASARTWYPDCAFNAHYKPRSIVVFCADAGMEIRRIHWYHWAGQKARGRSSRAYANDCLPSCAAGHFHRYRVRILLRRVRFCSRTGVDEFTRMRITFRGRKWSGPRRFTQPLACGD